MHATTDTPVDQLEVCARAQHAMRNANLKTIGDILALGQHGLLCQPNCGRRTVNEITLELQRLGFDLPYKPLSDIAISDRLLAIASKLRALANEVALLQATAASRKL